MAELQAWINRQVGDAHAEQTNSSKPNVLLIVEDITYRKTVQAYLEAHGALVTVTEAVQDAIHLAEKQQPNTVIIHKDLLLDDTHTDAITALRATTLKQLASMIAIGESFIDTELQAFYKLHVFDHVSKDQASDVLLTLIHSKLDVRHRVLATIWRDDQTGAYNRTFLKVVYASLAPYLHQYQLTNVTYTMIDLDHFKQVNDRFGHHAGDQVLTNFVESTSEFFPEGLLFRLGGEEFLLLTVNMDESTYTARMEEWRTAFSTQIHIAGDAPFRVTFSSGYTLFPQEGAELDHVLKEADAALYEAKYRGRNQLVRFSSERVAAARPTYLFVIDEDAFWRQAVAEYIAVRLNMERLQPMKVLAAGSLSELSQEVLDEETYRPFIVSRGVVTTDIPYCRIEVDAGLLDVYELVMQQTAPGEKSGVS